MRLWIAWACLAGCYVPDHPPITGRVVEVGLPSTHVAETYRILIRLPPQYDTHPMDDFRVIYQLDAVLPGLNEFQVTSGFASSLEAQGKMPPAIVVGIGHYYDDEPGTGRFRDFTFPVAEPDHHSVFAGEYRYGADAFRAFIRDELIPYIDSHYRTDGLPGTLVGHSLGGLFVLYSLFQYPDTPFDKFIAASPTSDYENAALFTEEKKLAARGDVLPVRLFMGVGALEAAILNVYFDAMAERMRRYRGLDFQAVRYEGTDHGEDIETAYPAGLAFVEGP